MADPQTLAYVRLLIADTDSSSPLLSDVDLDTLLAAHGDNALLGAADALDIIATSEVLLSKKIRTQDLSTDGPAVAAELRKQATAFRKRADDDAEAAAWGGFDAVDTARSCANPELTEYVVWGL